MNNLKVIEQNGMRVLTTQQLAEAYGTDSKKIIDNFGNNKERYILGKHYIVLEGDELKAFKNSTENFGVVDNRSPRTYLWTEKGCFLAAKSLNTDKAWEAYDRLIDGYFTIKQDLVDKAQLSPQTQLLMSLAENIAKSEIEQKRQAAELGQHTERLEKIEQKQESMKEAFKPISSELWRKDATMKFNRVQKASEIPFADLYTEMYAELDRRAGANTAIRLANRKERMRIDGESKTNIKRLTRMDIIESDKKLRAIFEKILTEYELRYCS